MGKFSKEKEAWVGRKHFLIKARHRGGLTFQDENMSIINEKEDDCAVLSEPKTESSHFLTSILAQINSDWILWNRSQKLPISDPQPRFRRPGTRHSAMM